MLYHIIIILYHVLKYYHRPRSASGRSTLGGRLGRTSFIMMMIILIMMLIMMIIITIIVVIIMIIIMIIMIIVIGSWGGPIQKRSLR